MRYVLFIFIAVSVVYTQDCNANNWQQYSPNLEYCDLEDVNIAWMDLSGFNFLGANLTNSNLTGSDFSGANLTNATIRAFTALADLLGFIFRRQKKQRVS